MINTRLILPAALIFSLAAPAFADDLGDAARGLCDNVKTCALEKVAQEELTPEVREMMGPMLDNMCASVRSQIQDVPVDHQLYKPAVGCMRSLQSLTCAELQGATDTSTPECKEYEKLTKEVAAANQ